MRTGPRARCRSATATGRRRTACRSTRRSSWCGGRSRTAPRSKSELDMHTGAHAAPVCMTNPSVRRPQPLAQSEASSTTRRGHRLPGEVRESCDRGVTTVDRIPESPAPAFSPRYVEHRRSLRADRVRACRRRSRRGRASSVTCCCEGVTRADLRLPRFAPDVATRRAAHGAARRSGLVGEGRWWSAVWESGSGCRARRRHRPRRCRVAQVRRGHGARQRSVGTTGCTARPG